MSIAREQSQRSEKNYVQKIPNTLDVKSSHKSTLFERVLLFLCYSLFNIPC